MSPVVITLCWHGHTDQNSFTFLGMQLDIHPWLKINMYLLKTLPEHQSTARDIRSAIWINLPLFSFAMTMHDINQSHLSYQKEMCVFQYSYGNLNRWLRSVCISTGTYNNVLYVYCFDPVKEICVWKFPEGNCVKVCKSVVVSEMYKVLE